MESCWGHDMFVQVDLRKVAVGDADEELLGIAVEFADPDLLR